MIRMRYKVNENIINLEYTITLIITFTIII